MEPTRGRGWKFYVGVALFVYSFGTLGIAALVPFLFSPSVAAALVTGVVVSGEIGFWLSAALLGKPFIDALKAKMAALLARHAPRAPRPVSRPRHAVGLVLFSLSFVTYYVAMAIPFLRLSKHTELTAIVVAAITGELLFVSSLFVLGGEFWERIKALYRWPGQPDAPGATGPTPPLDIRAEGESASIPAGHISSFSGSRIQIVRTEPDADRLDAMGALMVRPWS